MIELWKERKKERKEVRERSEAIEDLCGLLLQQIRYHHLLMNKGARNLFDKN